MNTKNLRINYHIEIINDKKTWDKLLRVTENYKKYRIEPWELYTNKDFDTFEKALEYYMVWYVSDQCYDIKMWEQVFMDDEMIYEEYVEPHCTTRSKMRRIVNRDAELNTKSDYCQVCGYDGEIKIVDEDNQLIWECPNCKNRDKSKMNVSRRTCGYIGTNFWNQGRTEEINERYVHLDNHEYVGE